MHRMYCVILEASVLVSKKRLILRSKDYKM